MKLRCPGLRVLAEIKRLVDPGSPATRLLPDADHDLTFAFVAAD